MSRTISVPYRRTISPFSGDAQLETHTFLSQHKAFVTVAIDSPSHCSTHTYTHKHIKRLSLVSVTRKKNKQNTKPNPPKVPKGKGKKNKEETSVKVNDRDGDKDNRLCRKPSNQPGWGVEGEEGEGVRDREQHPPKQREQKGAGLWDGGGR